MSFAHLLSPACISTPLRGMLIQARFGFALVIKALLWVIA